MVEEKFRFAECGRRLGRVGKSLRVFHSPLALHHISPWCFFLLHRGVSSAFTTVEKFFHHGGVFLSPRRFPLLPNHFLYGRAGRFDIRQGEVEAFGLNFQICARGLGVSDKIFKFARAKAVCSPGSRIFHPPLLCAICS